MITRQFIVTGHVQGVGFRWSVMMLAQNLHLNGQVRNNNDGSVTIVVQGTEQELANFLAKLPESLSPFAKIDQIEQQDLPDQKPLTRFMITN